MLRCVELVLICLVLVSTLNRPLRRHLELVLGNTIEITCNIFGNTANRPPRTLSEVTLNRYWVVSTMHKLPKKEGRVELILVTLNRLPKTV